MATTRKPFITPNPPVHSRRGQPAFRLSSTVEVGRATGNHHDCSMHGCPGQRVSVRWPNGKITFPCSKGMRVRANGDWEIF